jgi:hypothetical protein
VSAVERNYSYGGFGWKVFENLSRLKNFRANSLDEICSLKNEPSLFSWTDDLEVLLKDVYNEVYRMLSMYFQNEKLTDL